MLIRLHMWEVRMNYKKDSENVMCPICNKEEDTTEHVLECEREKGKKYSLDKEMTKEEWKEVLKIYRENKRKRADIEVIE